MVKPTIDSRPKKNSRTKIATNPNAGWDEFAWFVSEPAELEEYKGRYVGILGNTVVASGETTGEVYDRACELKLSDVFIAYVEAEKFDGYFIG